MAKKKNNTPVVETTEIPKQAPTIDISVIQTVVQIIDYSAEQGAFRGWEVIQQVLAVRNHLQQFLDQIIEQKPSDSETDK